MKLKLLPIILLAVTNFAFAQQTGSFWKTSSKGNITKQENKLELPLENIFELDIEGLKTVLANSPQRNPNAKSTPTIVSIPNSEGKMERFYVSENSTMSPELQAKYPEIRSYIGTGVDNPTLTAHFSNTPLGFKSMVLGADRAAVFIEPISSDLKIYTVYKKSDKREGLSKFECTTKDHLEGKLNKKKGALNKNADDRKIRILRLAISVTGEYTKYFGGTKTLANAAIVATMTRVNGIFEKDFGARMLMIPNNDNILYTSASSDPYSKKLYFKSELSENLRNTIGNANFDIGHLFNASILEEGGGNSGCIGCITNDSTTNYKGSGFTAKSNPSTDVFDIEYVSHEMGHQFGANHTWTKKNPAELGTSYYNEGTGAQVEPGSGSTIMSYAGITDADIAANSDAYFHAKSIEQVTDVLKSISSNLIATNVVPLSNAVPIVNAKGDFTIPKSTPFVLMGEGSDPDGDVLYYNWEQMDNGGLANNATVFQSSAYATKTKGPNFRSFPPTKSKNRFLPKIESTVANSTTTQGLEIAVEALSSVARTLNFRLTARDNKAGGGANNSDDMVVTVNAIAGPFLVTAPNTLVSYVGGSTQTITWNVAGTDANGVNCYNVAIYLSKNGGLTWDLNNPIVGSTPNDGSQAITIPNTPGTTNRIMVKAADNIFFDISNSDFTITAGSTADTTAPTTPTLTASGTTQTTTNLSWTTATDNVGVTGYNIYNGTSLLGTTTTATTYAISALTEATAYTFTVKAIDAAGNLSVVSNPVYLTTTTTCNAPTSLVSSAITATTATVSWAISSATNTGYVLEYKTNAESSWTIATAVTTTTRNITGLLASTGYIWRVKTNCSASNVSSYATGSFTTIAATVNCVDAFEANDTNATASQIIVNQIVNAGIKISGDNDYYKVTLVAGTSYTITLNNMPAINKDYDLQLLSSTGTSIDKSAQITGANEIISAYIPKTTGTYYVYVFGYEGNTTNYPNYNATTCYELKVASLIIIDSTAPTTPTLTASGTTQTTTNLSWTAASDNIGVTGYNIYNGTALLGSTTSTTFAVTGLFEATAYTFTVKAKDAAGNLSVASNSVSLTTTSTCNTPTSLISSAITATGATVSWAISSVANTGYVLEYKTNSETTWTITTAAIATSRSITGLNASTAYSWRVKTNCSASSASSYATGNFTTIAAPVNCVDAFEANGTTATASLININQIVNAGIKISGDNDYYKVNLVAGTSYTITLNNMPAINKDYDLQLLDATGAQLKKSAEITGVNEAISAYIATTTGTYYVYVYGYEGSTYSNYNATTCYELKVANGFNTTNARDDEKSDLTFGLYPNPVEDVLNIAMINNGKTTYRIYSMIGQEVKSGRLNKTEISVSNLESGMYIFEVYDGEKTITKKFVKR